MARGRIAGERMDWNGGTEEEGDRRLGRRRPPREGMCMALVFLVVLFTGSSSALEREEGIHIVRSGETLYSIARSELGDGERWKELARLNGITDPRRLFVGQRLRLPAGEGEG
ncbi:MAG: LysM domain-containing protein, partial [Candidatus Hydrogenedentota bacterium]